MLFAAQDAPVAIPQVYRLGADVGLVVWDDGGLHTGRFAIFIDGAPAARPHASVVVPTSDGGRRLLLALRLPPKSAAAPVLSLRDPAGVRVLETVLSGDPALLRNDAPSLAAAVPPAGQVRIVRFVLNVCRAAFGLGRQPAYVQFCRDLVGAVAPQPVALPCRSLLTDRLALYSGRLPAGFGNAQSVVAIGRAAVDRSRFLPAVAPEAGRSGEPAAFELMADRSPAGPPPLLVIIGTGGIACRLPEPPRSEQPNVLALLESAEGLAGWIRDYVIAGLGRAADRDRRAAALLRDIQVVMPQPVKRLGNPKQPLGAAAELAVEAGAGGLFLSGWLRDPYDLVERLVAVSPFGVRPVEPDRLHRLRRPDIETRYKDAAVPCTERRFGFVAYLPGSEEPAAQQFRLRLELRSGSSAELVAPLAPVDPAAARNAVLGSVPPAALTPEMLADCVAPAAASLHRHALAAVAAPNLVEIGAPAIRPTVSVVVPLYRNLSFLRFQIAAFAADPDFREAELIYVLDSPEQRGELEHLLRGLHALYGLPLRLVVMARNAGYAAANNAGAQFARGRLLLLLNSDVVPVAPGWLQSLSDVLQSSAGIAAVGPKLLFDDGSLQHAGLFFERDFNGEWFNQHFFKGYPRDYRPANVIRAVPAVTGAALLVRREHYERVGGFTEDYIIGDYEDSDLCLKLRSLGKDIWYVPRAELYHFERRSIELHAAYTRTVASAYNRWLHALRWDEAMTQVMSDRPVRVRVAAATAIAAAE